MTPLQQIAKVRQIEYSFLGETKKAPPSRGPLEPRLIFLTRWAREIGPAIAKVKNDGLGKRLRKYWEKTHRRFLSERDAYRKYLKDPSLDTLDNLANAPKQLDYWETTFAALNKSIKDRGGKAPKFTPSKRLNKAVSPRLTRILRGIAGDVRRETERAAKHAFEAVEESAVEAQSDLTTLLKWAGAGAVALAGVFLWTRSSAQPTIVVIDRDQDRG